ncbi:DNA translocase FtsK [Neisseria leonii]|uniref:DNA translocase FtsK n=1 Tax=Neisseria leonii TaxID=2995413 RepID=UPI00237C4A46|nr:DNA translocase FtsK [Neisseria sp. 3986]MDD9325462.1 FtsK/SpoIIIE domain-containing protein [Neisseria sp. 3986]
MLWIVLIVLLAAMAALLWWNHKQEQEWRQDMAYFNRHETAQVSPPEADVKPAKMPRGADSNLQDSRSRQKTAHESRLVYERTMEKLLEISPKRRRLAALNKQKTLPPEEDTGMPLFAAPHADGAADGFREIGISADDSHTAGQVAAGDGIQTASNGQVEIITLEEAMRSLREPSKPSIPAPDAYRSPSADLPVISLEEATRTLHEELQEKIQIHPVVENAMVAEDALPQPPSADLPVIGFNDPAVMRTRERTLAEVEKLAYEQRRPEPKAAVREVAQPPRQTIGEDDIRSNLLRQRMARRRQISVQEPVNAQKVAVIAEDEVLANLAKTDSPLNRRLRRISTAVQASVLPAAARVDEAHASEVVRPKTAADKNRPDSALSNRYAPYSAAAKKASVPSASATVVEPPAVPPTPPLSVSIASPAAFDSPAVAVVETPKPVMPDVHISDAPRWSITDRLVSESVWEADSRPSENGISAGLREAEEQAEWHGGDAEADDVPVGISEAADNAYPLPGLNLLLPASYDPNAAQSDEALLENSITIEEKLAEYKVKVKVMDAYAGPVITRYEIEPDVGVRGSAVMNLERDLARSLGVSSIRVVETIPGKTCMGLELPNPRRQMIRLSEIFSAPVFQESKSKLTLALGQDITGQPVVTDLAKAPHLLVAGTTGSGKSVGVNAMILSMLFKASPEDVRMIMIDPKMLELSIYEGIPHLLAPVVTDMRLAANALNWCVNEMEKRYRLMSHVGVRNLAGFNQKIRESAARGEKIANPFSLTPDNPEYLEKLPFIVVVVDEFADLMMTAGKKIEELIARLAQKARAAGIHLILATQRPSVDVITGLIKANIPTRIAFQVSSKIDSRTILDQMGAENLLGQGDMLFLPPGTGYPQRVHGAFASDDEVHGVVEYLKQFGEPDYIDDILTSGVGSDDIFSNANDGRSNEGDQDPLYDEAVAFVIKSQKATISSVQRQLRIGYNRAANLIEQMENDGIVTASDSAGKRTVLARDSSHLDPA